MVAPLSRAMLQGWLHTSYCIESPCDAEQVRLRLGQPAPPMTRLHAQFEVGASAFVTAWNPFSTACAAAQNHAAHGALREHLDGLGMRCLEAVARPDAGWPAEPGVLVLGADATLARGLCVRFRQHGAVLVAADAVPRLVLHPDLPLDLPMAQMPWILA